MCTINFYDTYVSPHVKIYNKYKEEFPPSPEQGLHCFPSINFFYCYEFEFIMEKYTDHIYHFVSLL